MIVRLVKCEGNKEREEDVSLGKISQKQFLLQERCCLGLCTISLPF